MDVDQKITEFYYELLFYCIPTIPLFPSEILSNQLYLGSFDDALNEPYLKQRNISSMISLVDFENQLKIRREGNSNWLYFENVDDVDTQKITHLFQPCFDFIEQQNKENKSVLVHCSAGMSRSATIVIAFLMKKYKLRMKEACIKVKQIRSCVCPNVGFLQQLFDYETFLLKN